MAGRKPFDRERFRKAFRELGTRIALERSAHEWTQAQLAEASGLSITAVGEIERADSGASVANLLLIAGALDLPLATLVQGLDAMVGPPSEYADDDG